MIYVTYKKIYSIGLIFMLAKPCFAGTMNDDFKPIDSYNGVYIGADIGLTTLFQKVSSSLNGTAPSPLVATSEQPNGHFGITGGGILGYDYSVRPKIKLGIEEYFNGTNVSIKTITADYGSQL